jgi:hypothetical protein
VSDALAKLFFHLLETTSEQGGLGDDHKVSSGLDLGKHCSGCLAEEPLRAIPLNGPADTPADAYADPHIAALAGKSDAHEELAPRPSSFPENTLEFMGSLQSPRLAHVHPGQVRATR